MYVFTFINILYVSEERAHEPIDLNNGGSNAPIWLSRCRVKVNLGCET